MPAGEITFFGDADENVGRVSTAGRIFMSESFTRIKKHSPINVTSASGGSQLDSTPVGKVYLRSESGNAVMWWGGTGNDAPYSGHGYPLWGGEQTIPITVTDFAAIQIVAAISGQIVYPIGFLNGEDTTLPNTVPHTPDIISPFIVSHSPVSGLSGVSLDSQISIRLSETISENSVVSGVFRLSPSHNVTIYRDVTNTTDVILSPNQNLSGSTVYFATLVSGTVTDLAGNICMSGRGFPFTTTNAPPPPDVTAPKVSGITPVSGTSAAGTAVSPVVTFSEQMLSGTINGTNIFITSVSGASVGNVAATVSLDVNDKKTVTVDPTSDLTTGTTYYVNVLTGAQDLSSNALSPEVRNHKFDTSYNFVEVYNVSTTADDNSIGSSDDEATGTRITGSCALRSQAPKRVVIRLYRGSTSTTGTASIIIRNGSNTNIKTFGTFAASVLTTSPQDITITNLDNTTTLETGYSLLLEYTGSGSIHVYRTTSNSYSGASYYERDSGGSYDEDSNMDTAMKVYK